MSGPIVRKYGFPNFDDIFGSKPLQHGVDEDDSEATPDAKPAKKKAEPKPKADPKSKAKKK